MGNKSWDDVLLEERESNSRLRQQQRDQAERERRLVERLAQLKEQQQALQQGKTVDAVGRDGKVKALEDQLAGLNQQNKELESKLQAAKAGQPAGGSKPHAVSPSPASSGARASRPGSATRGHEDGGDAPAKIEELKRKLLETNRQIKQLEEKQKTSDLLSTLDLYQSELSEDSSAMGEREELRKELKLKEAKYTVAKNEFDKLDKEYKEYAEKHKTLEEQAKGLQEQILAQEKQKRDIERDIKQMKLERDASSDQKNILADLKEELKLLKEENKQLNQDSMSGKSLQEKSQVQDQEVLRLREENDVLVQSIEEQEARKKILDKRFEDAQKQQSVLAKEVDQKNREVDELNRAHQELVSSLSDFSVDPDSSGGVRDRLASQDLAAGKSEGDDLVAQARIAMSEQLLKRNLTVDAAFKSWDSNGDGLLTQEEFVDGAMGLRSGLQRDEARQLFQLLIKADATDGSDQMTRSKFEGFLGMDRSGDGSSALGAPGAGSEEAQVLEGELRKLRTLNAQLLKEKDELFQSLREAERSRRGHSAGGEVAQAERLQEIEQMHAAQLRKLQDDLAVAEYNQQDLMQLIGTYQESRVVKPGAGSVQRGGPRTSNVMVLEITSLQLDASRDGMLQDEPTTFFSVDFFAHDTQVTPPCTGFDVNIGWSCEFEVEEDDLLLSYMDTDALSMELMQRVNEDTPFKRLASCRVPLKGLLDRASLVNQPAKLLAADGRHVGQAIVHMRMRQSIFASVERYRRSARTKTESLEPAANASMLEALGVPLDKIQLAVTIERCDSLRAARYGSLPWPYCQYELPVPMAPEQDPHITETRTKESNPVFNDRRIWDLPTAELALALRSQDLQVFVFDDQDQDDMGAYLGFAKVRLAPIFLAPAQALVATLNLQDPRGVTNGTISIRVEWHTPASVAAAEAQRRNALAQPSASDSVSPISAPAAISEKSYQNRKVASAKVGGATEEWLGMLRDRIKEVGDSPDKVFSAFDKDGDGELSFDDFKVSIDNEPLGLDADQVRKLFEFIADAKDKDITRKKFRDAIAPGIFGILPDDKQHMVLFYRQVSFVASSPLWEEILEEKGNLRLTVVTDWFTQPPEETLGTSSAKKLLITARRATAEFSHKEVFRMDDRANRARVEGILEKQEVGPNDLVDILLCRVSSEGKVDLSDFVGRATLNIRSIFKDKSDASELNLQLADKQGKGVANLTLDTGILDSLTALSKGGVGAVAASMSGVDWEASVTSKLSQLMGSKGISPAAAFASFDDNCDGEIDWAEFEAAIRNEPLQLDDAQRKRFFDYLCGGQKTIDLVTWKAKMSGSVVAASGVVSAQEAKNNILVMVKSAKVNESILKQRQIKYLCVRVDFTRKATGKLASTQVRPLKEGSTSVELNDRLTMPLKADSSDMEAASNRKHIIDALASKSQGDANIDVILVGLVDEGQGKRREMDLGVAPLDLKKLFRDGDDLEDFSLMPEHEGSSVGKIVLSLYFMQALRALNVNGKSATNVGAGAGSSGGGGAGAGGSGGGKGPGGEAGENKGAGSQGSSSSTAKSSSSSSGQNKAGTGQVALAFSQLRLEPLHALASDDKIKNLFLSANFMELLSSSRVAKSRSSPIALDDLRADKDKCKTLKHVVQLDVDDSLHAANRDALAKVFTNDENSRTGLLSLVLYRDLMSSEYNADGDTQVVARGVLSLNDMLHASLVEDEVKEVPLMDDAGALVAHCKVSMTFNKVSLAAVAGHTPFKQDELSHNLVVQMRQLQPTPRLRGVSSIAVAVKLQGAKEIVLGSKSRSIEMKDLTAGQLPRGDLCLNHKVLMPLASLADLRQSLLDVKTQSTLIKLMILNASDDSEIAECDIDLKKDVIDKRQDLSKHNVTFLDLDGSTSLAKGVVDVALMHAISPLRAASSAQAASEDISGASGSGGGKASRSPTEMSIVVDKLAVDHSILSDATIKKLLVQAQWLGVKEHRSIGLAPSATLPLKHEFVLDVASEHKGTTFKDLISQGLAKEARKGGAGNVQLSLVAQLDGASADKVLACGVIDISAFLFEQHTDGALDMYLVPGTTTDAAATAAASSGTKLSLAISFRKALGQIGVRLQERQAAASHVLDPRTQGIVERREGSQLAAKSEKESNLVLVVKGVELSNAALSSTKSEYAGPLFVAVDFFGDASSDDVAARGTDAYLRQQLLPVSERFLCPVDSGHEYNRTQLKHAFEKKDMSIGVALFHEPWTSGTRAWASATLASSHFLSREGADIQVHLKDEDTHVASVFVQVHSAEALKMLGI